MLTVVFSILKVQLKAKKELDQELLIKDVIIKMFH